MQVCVLVGVTTAEPLGNDGMLPLPILPVQLYEPLTALDVVQLIVVEPPGFTVEGLKFALQAGDGAVLTPVKFTVVGVPGTSPVLE